MAEGWRQERMLGSYDGSLKTLFAWGAFGAQACAAQCSELLRQLREGARFRVIDGMRWRLGCTCCGDDDRPRYRECIISRITAAPHAERCGDLCREFAAKLDQPWVVQDRSIAARVSLPVEVTKRITNQPTS